MRQGRWNEWKTAPEKYNIEDMKEMAMQNPSSLTVLLKVRKYFIWICTKLLRTMQLASDKQKGQVTDNVDQANIKP